jgi:hypothetical protein
MSRRNKTYFLARITRSRDVYKITIPKRIVLAARIDELFLSEEKVYANVELELT